MKRFHCTALAALAVTLGAVSAQAADLPRKAAPAPVYALPAPYNWSGFYLGINGGFAGGRSSWNDPAAGGDSGNFRLRGGMLGGQFGYNWQMGRWVLGLESDADWLGVKGGATSAGGVCGADGGGQCQVQQNWAGTTRARIGYAFDRFLPYITGGAAYGDVQANQLNGSSEKLRAGWAAGAGVEYGITKNVTAKMEFMHLDLGTATFMGAASGTPTLSVPVTNNTVRAGLNYRFSW
ncbi:MAG TPA: outer membrane protein [Pseudolabrys sp.]|nr:outer membrane protein [Pseudolabrys sp.]